MSDVAMVDSRTEHWRSFRVCPGIQPHFPVSKKASLNSVCTNTGLLALVLQYLYQHRFAGPGAILEPPNHVPAQLCCSWCVQNPSVLLFDLSKPTVFISFQTKKQKVIVFHSSTYQNQLFNMVFNQTNNTVVVFHSSTSQNQRLS